MQLNYIQTPIYLLAFFTLGLASCKKLTQVAEPVNTITTSETFGADATANSAIVGIYNDIIMGHGGNSYNLSFGNGLTTINTGMSGDELHIFNGPSPFETNTLNSLNFPGAYFWNGPYFDIYLANAAIEGLQSSTAVSATMKNRLMGEAKFFRAFCHFLLSNLFGDIPLVTSTAYSKTDTLHRVPTSKVFQLILADLQDAQRLLPVDYSNSNNERIRLNQSGATALLARVYLYQQQWDSAEIESSLVINNNLYSLENDLNSVFLANSSESILQWEIPNISPYANKEANTIIPSSPTSRPIYYLTDQLLGSFEIGDNRKINWIDSTKYSGKYYYYPYKYKIRVGANGNIPEYYMVLRLAEQYLIRAEARAHKGELSGAISDLNIIRERAGLTDLPASLTQDQILSAVMQERRVELFTEWGHRWFDLKRTGQINLVLSATKSTWHPDAQLYPIPANELVSDANLVQNPGY